MEQPSTNLIDSAEACTILAIDRSTLSRWVAAGKLTPAMRAGTGPQSAFVFNRSDVEAFASTLTPASEPDSVVAS
jgi:predicted site-specific integrase-resolvase